MKWYSKEFVTFFATQSKDVCNFLNRLNSEGVNPLNIKVMGMTASFVIVMYYHTNEVK